MIYNYLVLDFYKEIESYLHENQYQKGGQSDEVMRHLNEINTIIEQNNLNHVDYDTDMLEKVRDECADYLKSLEMDHRVDIYCEPPALEMNEGVTDAIHGTVMREMPQMNSKQSLDKTAEKNAAKIARLRSGSRPKVIAGDNGAGCHQTPWDPHHT